MNRLSIMILMIMLLININGDAAFAAGDNSKFQVSEIIDLRDGEKVQAITLNINDMELNEVMEMLSSVVRSNILLGKNVSGKVNVNLYNVSPDDAIHSIASISGYSVERRNGTYFIASQEELDKNSYAVKTQTAVFEIEYSDPTMVETAVKKYLSAHGMVTVLKKRRLLVVEDIPAVVHRIAAMLSEIDAKPVQVMIEAKILEVTLDNNETYGINWRSIAHPSDGSGSLGLGTVNNSNPSGFFVNFVNNNVDLFLEVLESQGRVRTLSTPKLLTIENQDASVVIGDRIGYKTTTTINAVTTESIEFLESGVILKVRSTVDDNNQILLNIHPEVSTGTISDGIPSQKTTEVTTQLIVPDGASIFIGGLMRNSQSEREAGVPYLRRIPGLKWLFASREKININTETLVLITPKIIDLNNTSALEHYGDRVKDQELKLDQSFLDIDFEMEE